MHVIFGEQPSLGQADADVDERDRQLVGQPLQMVGHLDTVAAVEIDEVQVIDDPVLVEGTYSECAQFLRERSRRANLGAVVIR